MWIAPFEMQTIYKLWTAMWQATAIGVTRQERVQLPTDTCTKRQKPRLAPLDIPLALSQQDIDSQDPFRTPSSLPVSGTTSSMTEAQTSADSTPIENQRVKNDSIAVLEDTGIFEFTDFYNKISPRNGYPYARSKRLTTMLLTLVEPIDCSPYATAPNTVWSSSPVPIYGYGRRDWFEQAGRLRIASMWMAHGRIDCYELTQSIAGAYADNRYSLRGIHIMDEEAEIDDMDNGWDGLPSPISPLHVVQWNGK